eukprot:SAG22_NODE_4528_length_1242_cov_1.227273_3_plen_117_part_01
MDGVVFDKTPLAGSGTNIVHTEAVDGMMVWLDHDPPSPDQRWVMAEVRKSVQYPANAQYLYSSADGITWNYRLARGPNSDRSTLYKDVFRGVWVFSLKWSCHEDMPPPPPGPPLPPD